MNLQRRNGHHERASQKTRQWKHFPVHCSQHTHFKQVVCYVIEKNILGYRTKENETATVSEELHT